MFDFDWHTWQRGVPDSLKRPGASATRAQKIAWGLGETPGALRSPGGHYGEQCDDGPNSDGCFVATMLTHDRFQGIPQNGSNLPNVTRQDFNFGEYITGSVYYINQSEPLPVVIFLHPLSYHSGFSEGYIESISQTAVYYALAQAGFAVIAYDAIGFGARLTEFNGASGGTQGGNGLPLFYRRSVAPRW